MTSACKAPSTRCEIDGHCMGHGTCCINIALRPEPYCICNPGRDGERCEKKKAFDDFGDESWDLPDFTDSTAVITVISIVAVFACLIVVVLFRRNSLQLRHRISCATLRQRTESCMTRGHERLPISVLSTSAVTLLHPSSHWTSGSDVSADAVVGAVRSHHTGSMHCLVSTTADRFDVHECPDAIHHDDDVSLAAQRSSTSHVDAGCRRNDDVPSGCESTRQPAFDVDDGCAGKLRAAAATHLELREIVVTAADAAEKLACHVPCS